MCFEYNRSGEPLSPSELYHYWQGVADIAFGYMNEDGFDRKGFIESSQSEYIIVVREMTTQNKSTDKNDY